MTSRVRPLQNFVAIRKQEAETISKGGLFLPPQVTEGVERKTQIGYVIAVGPDVPRGSGAYDRAQEAVTDALSELQTVYLEQGDEYEPFKREGALAASVVADAAIQCLRDSKGIAPGDLVAFAKYGGQEFIVDGQTIILIAYTEIFGVLESIIEQPLPAKFESGSE